MENVLKNYRVAIVQRVLPKFRFPLFKKLHENGLIQFAVFSNYYGLSPVVSGISEVEDTKDIPVVRRKAGKFHAWIMTTYGISIPTLSLLAQIVRFAPDIVVLEGLGNIGNVVLLTPYLLLKRIPFIWWSLGAVPGRKPSLRAKVGDSIQRWYANRAAAVLTYSRHGEQFFEKLGVPKNKIFIAHNTLDEKDVLKQIEKCASEVTHLKKELRLTDQPVIVFSGTLKKGKRLEVLIDAMVKVRERLADRDPRLLIIGDGADFPFYKELAAKKNVEASIHFVGRQEDMASAFFLMGSVAVLPGLGGLAINHAFVHKLPVICGRADGCERDLVVDGETGYYLENMEAPQLEEALIKMIENEEKARKMGEQGFNLITQEITLGCYASSVEGAISSVLR